MRNETPPMPTDDFRTHDQELSRVAAPLKRHALAILLTAAVAGVGSYALTSRTAPEYEAASSVITVDAQGAPLDGAPLEAPSFPSGALARALHSDQVMQDITRELTAAGLPASTVQALSQQLQGEAASGGASLVSVSMPDGDRSALYEIRAHTTSPVWARDVANAATAALLRWDEARAHRRIVEARESLQAQLAALAGSTAAGTALTRAQLQQSVARLSALESVPSGSLEVVAEAHEPAGPVAPRPLRSALLAALLGLFAAGGVALLLEAWRRRVHDEDSLRGLPVPLLGHLPQRGPNASARDLLQAGSDRANLLRVNLLSRLPAAGPRRLVLTGVRQDASAGDVVMALAASFAATGQRVLVVDAAGAPATWTDPAQGPRPEPSEFSEGVDLLRAPAASLMAALDRLGSTYEAVLIHAPPMLQRSDAAALALHAEGLVLVVNQGSTGLREVERALDLAHTAQLPVIGLVLSDLRLPAQAPHSPNRRALMDGAGAPSSPGA